jgi:uncharacterized protein (TIGR02996 family)
MIDTRQAFLAAIIDAPEDDAPRLIYADWLDEHGECERAEFIRLQCALARPLPRGLRRELRKRVEELLSSHAWNWIPRCALWETRHWNRGFLYRYVTAGWNAESLLEVLNGHPVYFLKLHLDSLTGEVVDEMANLRSSPAFKRLVRIVISTCFYQPRINQRRLSAVFGSLLRFTTHEPPLNLLDLL